jgi:hypothetical protein
MLTIKILEKYDGLFVSESEMVQFSNAKRYLKTGQKC